MRFHLIWTVGLGLPLAMLAGCASVDRKPGFADVQSMASEHGITSLHWNAGTGEDQAVSDSVDRLLADGLTADEAVQIALLNNRTLQARYEDLRIAQADLVQAGLLKNPIFDGSIRFAEKGAGEIIDLGVAFDFLDVFFIPMRKAVAETKFAGAKLEVTGAVIDLAGQTRASYFELQAAEQMLEMRRTTLTAYEASFDFAKRLREAGNNTLLRVANEQAVYEEAKLAVVEAEARIAMLREELNVRMGLFGPRTTYGVAARLPDPPDEPYAIDQLERDAINRSLDLKLAQGAIEVSAKKLGITKPLGLLSDLEVGATAERDGGEWSVGPSVSVPIPIFSQGQPAVAKADAELRQAIHRYYALAVEVRSAVRSAYAKMGAAQFRVNRYRKTVLPLRQSIVNETQKQYNAMLVGTFQLLQAKRDQVDAGSRYIEAQRDYWIARAELEQIVSGRLVQGGLSSTNDSNPMTNSNDASGGH